VGEFIGFIGFVVVVGVVVVIVWVLLGGNTDGARDRLLAARSELKGLAGTTKRLDEFERELAAVKDRVVALEAGSSSEARAGRGDGTRSPAMAGSPAIARVLELLADGRKIEAIKAYREATGVGLAEAKDVVEAFERGVAD
jgi:ribosomal protein L7/L12